ncbi:glycosyltransferase [Calothrix sp. 336/3]|uniref:glycosyltransferase n=1 Tax=Calothrix sp. 336/3 TaxID=1337936 RepID=UPI0004E2CD0A|nr:glycosyltransferase [Calothrix sp. 336/3]AKG20949.1 glycosyl transferase group 1 [Calothrix sp. 336/3]
MTEKIRVLFISHAYVVGVNQGKLNAIASVANKTEVALLAPSNWKAAEWNRHLPVETPFKNVKIYTAPVLFPGRGGAHIFAPWTIWRVIRDFRPDVIQVEQEVFSLCAFELAIWCRLTSKPMVVFGWENMERKLPLIRRWTCKFVLDTAKLIIPGNQDGAKIMRQWGYQGLMEVMPQIGVDTSLFTPPILDTPSDEFNIGFLGRLVPEKGIDLIFAAASLLQQKGYKFKIILCGSGKGETELKQEAKKYQVEDFVVWRGGVRHEQAPAEISKFDVLILPSRTSTTWKEQFGHVLIEAMAMGVPVIGSNSGEIPNVIGRTDLVFPEDNYHSLAMILEKMICEPNWRQEIKRYSINRVEQYYTHEKIAERLIDLWQIVTTESGKEYATI